MFHCKIAAVELFLNFSYIDESIKSKRASKLGLQHGSNGKKDCFFSMEKLDISNGAIKLSYICTHKLTDGQLIYGET